MQSLRENRTSKDIQDCVRTAKTENALRS